MSGERTADSPNSPPALHLHWGGLWVIPATYWFKSAPGWGISDKVGILNLWTNESSRIKNIRAVWGRFAAALWRCCGALFAAFPFGSGQSRGLNMALVDVTWLVNALCDITARWFSEVWFLVYTFCKQLKRINDSTFSKWLPASSWGHWKRAFCIMLKP